MSEHGLARLDGKVAIVTGAGRNIGRAEALLLAREGASIVVNDVGAQPSGLGQDAGIAQAVVEEIKAMGGEAVAETSSASSWAAGKTITEAAMDAFGRIDILVNNAGVVRPARIDQMEEAAWKLVVDVSLTGPASLIRHAAPHMIKGRRGGVIINTGSPSGFGHYGMANYAAAKEGQAGMTRVVARDLGQFGVRCNLIRPVSAITGTYTPEIAETLRISLEELKIPPLWNRPMGEAAVLPLPEHVAALTAWLCTDAAAHVSGREFFIMGAEVGLIPETEMIRACFAPNGWTLEALDAPAIRDYLMGDIINRYVRQV